MSRNQTVIFNVYTSFSYHYWQALQKHFFYKNIVIVLNIFLNMILPDFKVQYKRRQRFVKNSINIK